MVANLPYRPCGFTKGFTVNKRINAFTLKSDFDRFYSGQKERVNKSNPSFSIIINDLSINPFTSRVKPSVMQNFLTFDSMTEP